MSLSAAVVEGNEWVINGGKMWTTNGTQADWMCMLVNTNDNPNPHRNKSLICVPMKSKGVNVHRYTLFYLSMWCRDPELPRSPRNGGIRHQSLHIIII